MKYLLIIANPEDVQDIMGYALTCAAIRDGFVPMDYTLPRWVAYT